MHVAFRLLHDRVGIISACLRRHRINMLAPLQGRVFHHNRVEICLYFTPRSDSIGHSLAQRMMIDEDVTPTCARPRPVVQ
jgi:hypothetical protein